MTGDEIKLKELDDEKQALCTEFRRRMSRLLDQEAIVFGLIPQGYYEIEIYY